MLYSEDGEIFLLTISNLQSHSRRTALGQGRKFVLRVSGDKEPSGKFINTALKARSGSRWGDNDSQLLRTSTILVQSAGGNGIARRTGPKPPDRQHQGASSLNLSWWLGLLYETKNWVAGDLHQGPQYSKDTYTPYVP